MESGGAEQNPPVVSTEEIGGIDAGNAAAESVANGNGIVSDGKSSKQSEQEEAEEADFQDVKFLLPEQSSLMPIRAPVSEDVEEDAKSTESGESFDSALERAAVSSTASFDTAVSPRAQSTDDESETARVMPKAVVTSEDKQSSSSSNSNSNSDNDEDDGENGKEFTEETKVEELKGETEVEELKDGLKEEEEKDEDESSSVMPVAKVTTEDDFQRADEVGAADSVEKQSPILKSESAQGLRVLEAEDDAEPDETKDAVTEEEEEEKEEKEDSATVIQEADKSFESREEEKIDEVAVDSGDEDLPVEAVAQNGGDEVVDKDLPVEAVEAEEAHHPEDHTVTNDQAEKDKDEAVTVLDGAEDASGEEDPTPKLTQDPDDAAPLIEDLGDEGDSEQVPETESEEEAEAESDEPTAAVKGLTPSLGASGPSLPARPTGRPASAVEASRAVTQASSQNLTANPQPSSAVEADNNGEQSDENLETREKLHLIRVKFLRLAQRLGQSVHNAVVAQVLYRLGLAEQLRGSRGVNNRHNAFSFERATSTAEEQEAAGDADLDFTCTIMVLGKTGVGKSATINSLFDEAKTETNAFAYSTKKVQEITGMVHGIKLRVIDTPGLLPAVADQRHNEKIMASVKRFIKKSPPDIVLYFDRLDMQSRDYSDLPLLRTITETFGAAIWFNAIVVLTHASSAPPEGPNGVALSYEMFVAQRSHVVQQTIRQAAGDMRLMNPVSLVENHPACRTNRAGERVLPNGQIWKPQLLLLCFASKILAEANTLLKLQENTPGKPFGMRSKVPPLPFLLSSLLQSRTPLKHPDEAPGEEDATDDDMDEVEESDDEEEFDDLPPFRRLTREELDQLDKKNRAAYFEELHLREKLFQKKQWKEELRRRKELKRRSAASNSAEESQGQMNDGYDDDDGKSAAVPVPLPDMVLPPSFDSDNPTHRYRYLETATQWLVRPVLETHGWDHDNGYDGLNLERMFVVGSKVPASISGQVTKDKKEANLTMECAASLKHGEGKVSQASFDVQTVGKDLSYTLRSETRFNNLKKNKTIAGMAMTMIGETLAYGLKLEDRLMIGKRIKVVMNGGALTGKGDTAYGGTVELSLRDKDFPIGRTLSTMGFSVMNWHGDFAVGGNLQSQFMVGRTMIVARGNLNNRGAGQITIKASSSEQLQMALVGIVPLVRALVGHKLFGSSQQV